MPGPATQTRVPVPMPQMGVSVTEGTIVAWSRQVGQSVRLDETLCEIATDKVDTEVGSPVAGTLAEILVSEGETVEVGTPLAYVATNASDPPAGELASPLPRYSPVVQRIALAHDVDLALVTGTGRGARVTKQDVLDYLDARNNETPVLASTATAPIEIEVPYAADVSGTGGALVEPLSRMRRVIAANMVHSKATAAHAHTWIEVDMTRVELRRKEVGTTALAFVARATIDALRTHPPH